MIPGVIAWKRPIQIAVDIFIFRIGSDVSLQNNASIFSLGGDILTEQSTLFSVGGNIEHLIGSSIFSIGDVEYKTSVIELQVGSDIEQDILTTGILSDSTVQDFNSFISLTSNSQLADLSNYIAFTANSDLASSNNAMQLTSTSF